MVKVLGVKVEDAIYSEFKEICERELKTISDILYEIITDFIQNYRESTEAEEQEGKESKEEKNLFEWLKGGK